ncbi:hypothetical protein BY458DRAFT_451229 [Sporodiniella umbellata]|nr:hypothetical protein BY458DRAFT_451229 [Sporodiniella umbellata]
MSTRASSLNTVSTANTNYSSTLRSVIPSLSANKSPSGTSLYLSCRSILEKLSLVPNMEYYIDFITEDNNINPLDKLWDICRQGVSLVVLFNALDPAQPLLIDMSCKQPNDWKKNVYRFIVACRNVLLLKDEDLFTLSDLYNDSTSGFLKVLHTIDIVLQVLEEKGAIVPSKLDNAMATSAEPKDTRDKVVFELLETERRYVLDLEVLQNYQLQVESSYILSGKTSLNLFGNLEELVEFQRRFLTQLEEMAQKPAEEQNFGSLFVDNEAAFNVYEPYCSNFFAAQDLVIQETPKLQKLSNVLDPTYELPSMLIKPVQRICKYPLLMQQLIKATHDDWKYMSNMEQGLQAIRRVTEKVNETQRRHENSQIVNEVKRRIDEMRPAQIDSFGSLLLHDKIMMSQSNAPEKEMQVYMFEKTILMCKESRDSTKNSTSTFSIKKKRRGSLEPKGVIVNSRIWDIRNHSSKGNYCLTINWKENGVDQVMFRFQNKEKMNLWEATLKSKVKLKKIKVSNTQLTSMKKIHPTSTSDILRTDSDIERGSSESIRSRSSTLNSKTSIFSRVSDYSSNFSFLSSESPHGFLNRSQSESIIPDLPSLQQSRERSQSSPNIKHSNQQLTFKKSLASLAESPLSHNAEPESRVDDTLKLKLVFNDGIYVIMAHLNMCYPELIQIATKKISAVAALDPSDKLRLKYKDEDGDFITMTSEEDLQMALEARDRPNSITLYVSI